MPITTYGELKFGEEASLVYDRGTGMAYFKIGNDRIFDLRAASVTGDFYKADSQSVAFTRTDVDTVSIKAGTRVMMASGLITVFDSATAVTMPSMTAGTDYAIYILDDGTLVASENFSAPTGYTTSDSRQIGGFHYAAGGNATGFNTGGDTTPQINPYSLWDLKFRPACNDPRGMALVAGSFWADIYLTGTDIDANGSSRNGVTIADGSAPPKVPTMFGGDGSTTYGSFTQFEAIEVLSSVGKQLLTYDEFMVAAFGSSEEIDRGSDAITTGISTSNTGSSNSDESFTSIWGVMQSSGCMWVWSRDLNYRADGADAAAITAFSWHDNAEGRGQIFSQGTSGLVAAFLGGRWDNGAPSGSRASSWNNQPWFSGVGIGARGRCDHLCHT